MNISLSMCINFFNTHYFINALINALIWQFYYKPIQTGFLIVLVYLVVCWFFCVNLFCHLLHLVSSCSYIVCSWCHGEYVGTFFSLFWPTFCPPFSLLNSESCTKMNFIWRVCGAAPYLTLSHLSALVTFQNINFIDPIRSYS